MIILSIITIGCKKFPLTDCDGVQPNSKRRSAGRHFHPCKLLFFVTLSVSQRPTATGGEEALLLPPPNNGRRKQPLYEEVSVDVSGSSFNRMAKLRR